MKDIVEQVRKAIISPDEARAAAGLPRRRVLKTDQQLSLPQLAELKAMWEKMSKGPPPPTKDEQQRFRVVQYLRRHLRLDPDGILGPMRPPAPSPARALRDKQEAEAATRRDAALHRALRFT